MDFQGKFYIVQIGVWGLFGSKMDIFELLPKFFSNFSHWKLVTVLDFSVTYLTENRLNGKSVRTCPPTFYILVKYCLSYWCVDSVIFHHKHEFLIEMKIWSVIGYSHLVEAKKLVPVSFDIFFKFVRFFCLLIAIIILFLWKLYERWCQIYFCFLFFKSKSVKNVFYFTSKSSSIFKTFKV